jgi:hypothetical protein
VGAAITAYAEERRAQVSKRMAACVGPSDRIFEDSVVLGPNWGG